MLNNSDGILVTDISMADGRPEKTNYPRPGYLQAVYYTVDGKQIKTTIFSSKKKEIQSRLENTRARIQKQNLRVKLNEAGRIGSEITMLF